MNKEKQSGDCKNCNSQEEKQIEELAISFHKAIAELLSLQTCRVLAKDFLQLGYRKQSEGEWYVNYMMSKKPSKRGRIIQYTTYTCSVCGKPNGRKKSKFCPECGAKMKGGAE